MTQTNIKKDYFWNSLGTLLQSATSPLLLVIVTRINGIQDSGIFSFAFAVSFVFWVFGLWGGRTYQTSDKKHEFSNTEYISSRILLGLVMLVGAVCFNVYNNYGVEKSVIILLLVFVRAFEAISDSVYGVMQLKNRLYNAGISLTYKALMSVLLFVVINFFTHDLILSTLSLVFSNLIVVLFYDLRILNKIEPLELFKFSLDVTLKSIMRILKKCFPVFIILFLTTFSLNIPRYFLDKYHESDIGYFGIIAMPVTLVVLLMMFILQPKVVHLSKLFSKKDYVSFNHNVTNIIYLTVLIGTAIYIATAIFGVKILTIIFGVNFSEYSTPLLVITFGGIASGLSSVLMNVLTIIRSFKMQMCVYVISNMFLLVFSFLVIKDGGVSSASILFAITSAAQAACLLILYYSQIFSINKMQRRR